ncbi:MAG: CCA tRNA nucleotidyltransferase [Nitrospirae bacterium]|nr:CCA tRNA nucleotidyltransferase [Nitrospirota bacterium]
MSNNKREPSVGRTLRDKAVSIVRKLRTAGYQAYFAGGVARDHIRGVPPADYDIATSAKPDEVLSLFPRAIPVGVSFGVVLVPLGKGTNQENEENVEIATFRSDGVYLDGRHPQSVTFSGEKEDALRRDFTINGIYFDPLEDKVIDYVGGREDLNRKIIRTIGDPEKRFNEDYLRLIRAVRFSAQLSFQIEPVTWQAIQKMAGFIQKVSGERIREELAKILTGPDPARGLTLLSDTGILEVILPEAAGLKRVGLTKAKGENALGHAIRSFHFALGPSFELAMGILLAGAGPEVASKACLRLKCSNHQIGRIVSLVKDLPDFSRIPQMKEADLKRFMRQAHFGELLELYRAGCLAAGRGLALWEFCSEKLKSYDPADLFPPPLISGNTLIEMGYRPGPRFKKILHALEALQLEKKIRTFDEARAWVLQSYPLDGRG